MPRTAPSVVGRKTDQTLTIAAGECQLIFDETGLAEIVDAVDGRLLAVSGENARPLTAIVGGTEHLYPHKFDPPAGSRLRSAREVGEELTLLGRSLIDDGDATTVVEQFRQDEWLATITWTITRATGLIKRSTALRYEGDGEVLLRAVRVGLPTALGADSTLLELVGAPDVPPSLPLADVGGRSFELDASKNEVLVAFRHADEGSLFVWPYSEAEFATATVEVSHGARARISYDIPIAARMVAGHEVRWGHDYICLIRASWPEALDHYRELWNSSGVPSQSSRPKWFDRALVYETHVGSILFDRGDLRYAPYPTVPDLIEAVPRIRDLGFDVLQYMPLEPYASYNVVDYFAPELHYGSPEDLRQLVEECHQHGMKIVLDLLIHGVLDKESIRNVVEWISSVESEEFARAPLPDWMLNFADEWISAAPERHPFRTDHPDWFVYDEDGSPAQAYTWAFDLENRAVQDHIIEAMMFYVREFGVDGFRVDAPDWNDFPSWQTGLAYRGSLARSGPLRLIARAQQSLRRVKSDIVLHTEPSGTPFRAVFDSTYSYDELWLIDGLMSLTRPTGRTFPGLSIAAYGREAGTAATAVVTAFQARTWLEHRRRSLPSRAFTVHQVDSHDSYWWQPTGRKYRREQYGPEGYRALLFAFAMLDGALMHFVGGETGNEDYMREIFGLRKRVHQLAEGRCDYLGVELSDENVFGSSWESARGWAIPVTNFGPSETEFTIELPRSRYPRSDSDRFIVSAVFGSSVLRRPGGDAGMSVSGEALERIACRLGSLQSALVVIDRE